MILELGSWYFLCINFFQRFLQHGSFCLTPCQQDDPFAFHDRTNTHSNSHAGYLAHVTKFIGICQTGTVIQCNQPGFTLHAATWFIKTYMSIYTNAEYLQIKAACLIDLSFILHAMFLYFILWDHAIG